jgi:hypothetical protein
MISNVSSSFINIDHVWQTQISQSLQIEFRSLSALDASETLTWNLLFLIALGINALKSTCFVLFRKYGHRFYDNPEICSGNQLPTMPKKKLAKNACLRRDPKD